LHYLGADHLLDVDGDEHLGVIDQPLLGVGTAALSVGRREEGQTGPEKDGQATNLERPAENAG